MKSNLLFLLFSFLSIFCSGQEANGIKFEKGLTWSELKEKAKKENKYIFLDGYTTWCIPCKKMAEDVFPLKEVGDFFNQNFINVAVQFDKTKNDNNELKKWYKDAELLKNLYGINSYPTYLFFSPDGQLAHVIKGAIYEPDEFIADAKNSLEPAKQVFRLKKEYDMGNRSKDFLLALINSAEKAGDYSNLSVYVNTYLSGEKELLTTQNFQIGALAVSSAEDIAYKMILENPKMANAVLGKHERTKILSRIIFDNEIFPLLRKNGKIKNSGIIINYSGEINADVNWEIIKSNLNKKYPDLSQFIYTDARLIYCLWTKDWATFNKTMDEYTANKENINLGYVANRMSYLIAFNYNKENAVAALGWAKVLLSDKKTPYFIKDYSCLLYAAEKREDAISLMQEYLNTKEVKDKKAIENLEKMKKGEDIYW